MLTAAWLSLMTSAAGGVHVHCCLPAYLMASIHARVLCRMPSVFFDRPYYILANNVDKLCHSDIFSIV
jgi:hypothetical protein